MDEIIVPAVGEPTPAFCTLVCRNVGSGVTAVQLVDAIQKAFPQTVVRHCDIPEPSMRTAFVEFMNERMAIRVCELSSKRPVKVGGSGRLEIDWPRGMEPFRQLRVAAPAPGDGRADAAAQPPPRAAPMPSRADVAARSAANDAADAADTKKKTLVARNPRPFTRLWWLPLAAFGLASGTLGLTMYTAKRDGFLPPTRFLIPISLWSNNAPAGHVYALGLSLVGCLLLVCAAVLWPVLAWIGDLAPSHRNYCRAAALAGVVAPVCMVVQATVPLTPAFSNVFKGLPLHPTTQDAVHQLAAGLFFVAGVAHTYAIVQLWDHLSGPTAPRLVRAQFPVTRFSYRQKYGALVCQALVPVANVVHPVVWGALDLPLDADAKLAVAGVAQFVVVGALLVFFASYARDLQFVHVQLLFTGGRHPAPTAAQLRASDGFTKPKET